MTRSKKIYRIGRSLKLWNHAFNNVHLCFVQKNVVIVDTPGIEGGNNVDQSLEPYLKNAFGFIYVINTNAAGGVQQSRVRDLNVLNTFYIL